MITYRRVETEEEAEQDARYIDRCEVGGDHGQAARDDGAQDADDGGALLADGAAEDGAEEETGKAAQVGDGRERRDGRCFVSF